MDRRRFLKVTAITGTSAALAGCGNPEHQIIRFVPDEELTPGIAVWKPTVCPLCNAGCALQARVMDGDAEVFRGGQPGVVRMGLARKLEGDAAHPVSQGRLCVRGQAALQVTYHPDRLSSPRRRVGERGGGQFEEISWDEALAELVTRLDAAVASGAGPAVAFLGRPRRGRRAELVAEFLRRLGAPPPVAFDIFDDAVVRRANAISFGRYQLPTLDLARTGYLVGFGADFLGTWNSPVAQSVAYGRMRQGQPGRRAKFVQIEPRMSQTGASADEWLAVRPGTEGVVALGLAHVVMRDGLRAAGAAGRAGQAIDGWAAGLPGFAPADVERLTGVAAGRVERLAREFAEHGPALAVIGGAALAHTNGLAQALAVNALNALVGSVGTPGGIVFTNTAVPPPPPARSLRDLLNGPAPEVLLLDEANPVFGAPPAWRVTERLSAARFIASFGSFVDETSALADLILPDHSFLESWVESAPESGAADVAPVTAAPAMRPLYDTRATPDVLLEVARRLARPLDPPLPWQTFEEMVQAAPAADALAPPPVILTAPVAVGWSAPQFDGEPGSYPFHFMPYASQALLDGSLAHLPWLQELPDPLTTAMWCSWVEINPRAAEGLGIADGDLVEVASAHGSVRAPAVLSPGIGPDALAMPVGQGHDTFTRYASGRGANPLRLLAAVDEPNTATPAWSATRVRVTKVGAGDGSLIRFAGATRERPDHHGRG